MRIGDIPPTLVFPQAHQQDRHVLTSFEYLEVMYSAVNLNLSQAFTNATRAIV